MFQRPIRHVDPFAAVVALFGLVIGLAGLVYLLVAPPYGIATLITAGLMLALAACVDRGARP